MSTSSAITLSGSQQETTEESSAEYFEEPLEESEDEPESFTGLGVSENVREVLGRLLINGVEEVSGPGGKTLQNEGKDKTNKDSLWMEVFKNYTLIRTSGDPNTEEEKNMLSSGFKVLTKEEFAKTFSGELLKIREEKESNLSKQLTEISQKCDGYKDSYFLDELSSGISGINPKIATRITKCSQGLTKLVDMNATLTSTYQEVVKVRDLLSKVSDQSTTTSAATSAMNEATLKFTESNKLNANMKNDLSKEIRNLKTIIDPSQCDFRMVVESVFLKILESCKDPAVYIVSTMGQFESLLLPTLLAFPLLIAGTGTRADMVRFGTLLRELKGIITTHEITSKTNPFVFDWQNSSLLAQQSLNTEN